MPITIVRPSSSVDDDINFNSPCDNIYKIKSIKQKFENNSSKSVFNNSKCFFSTLVQNNIQNKDIALKIKEKSSVLLRDNPKLKDNIKRRIQHSDSKNTEQLNIKMQIGVGKNEELFRYGSNPLTNTSFIKPKPVKPIINDFKDNAMFCYEKVGERPLDDEFEKSIIRKEKPITHIHHLLKDSSEPNQSIGSQRETNESICKDEFENIKSDNRSPKEILDYASQDNTRIDRSSRLIMKSLQNNTDRNYLYSTFLFHFHHYLDTKLFRDNTEEKIPLSTESRCRGGSTSLIHDLEVPKNVNHQNSHNEDQLSLEKNDKLPNSADVASLTGEDNCSDVASDTLAENIGAINKKSYLDNVNSLDEGTGIIDIDLATTNSSIITDPVTSSLVITEDESSDVSISGSGVQNLISGGTEAYIKNSVVLDGDDVCLDTNKSPSVTPTVAAVDDDGELDLDPVIEESAKNNDIGEISDQLAIKANIKDSKINTFDDLSLSAQRRMIIRASVIIGGVAIMMIIINIMGMIM